MSKQRPKLTVPLEEARARIATQITQGRQLPNVLIFNHEGAKRWYDYTADLLRTIFSTDEFYNSFTGRGSPHFDDEELLVSSHLKMLTSLYERLELYPVELPPVPSNNLDPMLSIERIIQRFHPITLQLRKRYDNRQTLDVSDEYDVQDLFHALLRMFFDDIRGEEWTPKYAGSSSRMDFLLKKEQIVIEIKKTRSGLNARELGTQLSIDIMKYRSHPDCRSLVCFVYDPEERIDNPEGIEHDLSGCIDNFQVYVFIMPKRH